MSVARAHLWHLPRLLKILWAGTRGQGPVGRRRDEDVRALGQLILRGKVQLWRREGRARAFLVRDGRRIHALYTSPDWRGRGGGAALVRQAQQESGRLELYAAEQNAAARQFYLRHGFREVSRGHGAGNDEGVPDILMTWERPIE